MSLLMSLGKDLDGEPPLPPGTDLRITAEGDDRITAEGDVRAVPVMIMQENKRMNITTFIKRLIDRYTK